MFTWPNYSRMSILGMVALGLAVLVAILAGPQLVVALWKGALVAVSAYGGYWLDRWLFPYARPHALSEPDANDGMWNKDDPTGNVFCWSMIRRAIVVVGTMAAFALAL